MPRDPRVDPKPGDVVVPKNKPGTGESATVCCQAAIGNLVAFTYGASDTKVYWVTRDYWCGPAPWIKGWEVLHAAD